MFQELTRRTRQRLTRGMVRRTGAASAVPPSSKELKTGQEVLLTPFGMQDSRRLFFASIIRHSRSF